MEFDWNESEEKPILQLDGREYESLPYIVPNFRKYFSLTLLTFDKHFNDLLLLMI